MAMSGQSVTTFSRESTRAVLGTACRRVGLNPMDAELLRLGENAIYRLHGVDAVVRIARNADHWADATKEVAVSTWLTASDVPAACTWEAIDQPIDVEGHPVTFWHYIDGRRGGPEDVRALGEVLRRVHALPPPHDFALPPEDVLGRIEARVDRAQVPREDRAFLLDQLAELASAIGELSFPLPSCVTHGDAHVQNLMVTSQGVELIDFERVAWGQPEWDLSMTAAEFVTAQFWTPDQYREFVDSYGFDILEWSGFSILRRAHEIKMTTWLMQNVDESSDIRSEYASRMATIREGRPGAPWRAF